MLLIAVSGVAFVFAFDPNVDGVSSSPTPALDDRATAASLSTLEPQFGASRANPAPAGMTATNANWKVEVSSILRGQVAADLVGAESLPEVNVVSSSSTLLAIEVVVRAGADLDELRAVDQGSFALSGSLNVRYDALNVPDFGAGLDASVGPDHYGHGYLIFAVGQSEDDFILEFRPVAITDVNDRLYLAVTPGATVHVPDPPDDVHDAAGQAIENAATPDVWVTNDIIAIRIIDRLAGDAARSFIFDELNGDGEDFPRTSQFVAVQLEALNVSDPDDFIRINQRAFMLAGNAAGSVRDDLTEPPSLDARLYPGGRATGWLVIEYSGSQVPTLELRAAEDTWVRYLRLE